jgi:hypothetical protein
MLGIRREIWEATKRKHTIFFSTSDMQSLPAKKLLRRLDQLRHGVGWNPTQDEAGVIEFTGHIGYVQQYSVRNFLTDHV